MTMKFKMTITVSAAQQAILRKLSQGWALPAGGATGILRYDQGRLVARARCSVDTTIVLRDKGLIRRYRRGEEEGYCLTSLGREIADQILSLKKPTTHAKA